MKWGVELGGSRPASNPPTESANLAANELASKRVGGAFYPTWRAGSKLWRLAQNKAYCALLAV